MKSFAPPLLVLTILGGLAFAQEANQPDHGNVVPPPAVGLGDNLYLNAGAGAERQPGEAGTGFAQAGANWAMPLTPPEGVAAGLQLGSSLKFRTQDPEWNATLGGFTRNLPTYQNHQGAAALLFDYQHTAVHNDLWAVRPIIGTTISARDALGIEGLTPLHQDRSQQAATQFTTFWTRGWSERLGTEVGAGYEFRRVDKTLFRARAALGLTRATDLWVGGDFNSFGNYAVGLGISYHFGETSRHASLDNIGGSGTGLFTPFPTRDFPALYRRTK